MLNQVNSEELDKILKSCPMGLALSDSGQKITWVNDTFQDYLGISADEICGQSIPELPVVLQPLFNSSSAVHIPKNAIRDDQWFMCSQKTLKENTFHYITDIGPIQLLIRERDLLKDELREALAVDEVTGMPNKVAMLQALEPQISRSRRYNNPLSIILMRVENIEQLDFIQTSGVMVPISQMLNDQVRWADTIGKISDSDFLLILPETSSTDCDSLVEKLNQRLDELPEVESLPEDFNLHIRFGYAEWEKGDDLSLLMNKARHALEN